jgi:Fic family protein
MAPDLGWPTLDYEERPWTPPSSVSRTELRLSRGPYRAAVPPAIASLELILPGEISALASEASAEVARFDADVGRDIAPFASVLLRSESAASSKIENLTASAKAIALAELGDPRRHNAAIIVSNVRTMQAALDLAEHLDGNAIIAIHEALLGTSQPTCVGHWRNEQVWIGGRNSPHTAKFVPPHHERVPAAIDDLVSYMARDDIPPLVQAAIAHAQFETIHPFPDGNGRVGRALIHALLRAKGLTRNVTVPVSAGLLTDTETYFEALTAYRTGNPILIVQRLSDAAFRAIGNGRELVGELHTVRERWSERLNARSHSAAWRLLDVVTRQPVINSPLVQKELGVTATNALRAIGRLVDAEVLQEVSGNRRNQLWQASEVLDALDQFAERSGRRS